MTLSNDYLTERMIMKRNETKYDQFALCREMFDTVEVIERFEHQRSERFAAILQAMKRVLITGEGSSRIFPGKNFKDLSLRSGNGYAVTVEGATEALSYNLRDHCIFGVSNSGRTKELINLFRHLQESGHTSFYGITATPDSPVSQLATETLLLTCGQEKAVAATKSVIEQALFFESLYYNFRGTRMPSTMDLARDVRQTLEMDIAPELIHIIAEAPVIYFAGRNNGVAEELSLKTNEISRKKSVFLEGTYALHGIEEVMQQGEVLLVIDPFEQEEEKFHEVIQKGAGVPVIAISSRQTIFPTILIPENRNYPRYIELVGGWNLLVELGLYLGIDPDKPVRARKVGNEA